MATKIDAEPIVITWSRQERVDGFPAFRGWNGFVLGVHAFSISYITAADSTTEVREFCLDINSQAGGRESFSELKDAKDRAEELLREVIIAQVKPLTANEMAEANAKLLS